MTGILESNAQERLRGLKWFVSQSDRLFDFDYIIQDRLESGQHNWEADYRGVNVMVENAPDQVRISSNFILETPEGELADANLSDLSLGHQRTLLHYRDRIIDNIKSLLEEINVPFTVDI